MAQVNWTANALQDVEDIAEYISKRSEKYASIQVQRFFEFVRILETSVYAGRIVPELKRKNILELILGNYRIVYRIVNKSRVDIISVHHGARLLENALQGRVRFKK